MKYYILLLLFITKSYSQSLNKEATIAVTYKFDFYNEIANENQSTISPETKKQINYVDDILKQNEYCLYISKNRSIYKKINKIESIEETNKFAVIAKTLSGGTYYCDTEAKEKICQKENGEIFNITRPLDEYKWTFTNESKMINGYKCYKATSHKEEFSKFRGKSISISPIVWYAPELPLPFGPSGLDGLPGLVLEGSMNGKSYFYATKIDFDLKEKINFERPTKGKYVTPQEYEDIQIKMINNRIQN